MTSHTTIYLPQSTCAPEELARPWHLLRVHCESLHRSGLPYQVQFDLPGERIVVLAEGTPQPIPPRRPPRYAILPPRMTLAQARQGLAEQLQLVSRLRCNVTLQWRRWRYTTQPEYKNRTQQFKDRRRAFGWWLASVCARHRNRLRMGWELRPDKVDYASCDAALGWRCPRKSQLTKHERNRGWLWALAYRYLGLPIVIEPFFRRTMAPPQANPAQAGQPATQLDRITAYRDAKVDLEYWQEMICLTGGGVPNER
jgi:hypothetical protein